MDETASLRRCRKTCPSTLTIGPAVFLTQSRRGLLCPAKRDACLSPQALERTLAILTKYWTSFSISLFRRSSNKCRRTCPSARTSGTSTTPTPPRRSSPPPARPAAWCTTPRIPTCSPEACTTGRSPTSTPERGRRQWTPPRLSGHTGKRRLIMDCQRWSCSKAQKSREVKTLPRLACSAQCAPGSSLVCADLVTSCDRKQICAARRSGLSTWPLRKCAAFRCVTRGLAHKQGNVPTPVLLSFQNLSLLK